MDPRASPKGDVLVSGRMGAKPYGFNATIM